jgi:phosphate transport system substrate-binding protein
LLVGMPVQAQDTSSTLQPGQQTAPVPPEVVLDLPDPLLVLGTTPLWAGVADNTVTPSEESYRELYAGRADLVLGTLPPPSPPPGTAAPSSVPVGVYAVAVAYALPGVNLQLDVPTLCALLAGRISVWNDAAVARLNPGVTLPALPVLISARITRNGVSLAVAGACIKAGVWPGSAPGSGWQAGAAFRRATLGAQRIDLRLPGTLAVFALQSTPSGVQVAALRAVGGRFVSPRSELGLSGPRLPGAAGLLPTQSFGVLHASDNVGAYPLRGLIWASYLPEQAYRNRVPERAQAILSLITALRSGSGRGVAGLPLNSWTKVQMTYRGERVEEP